MFTASTPTPRTFTRRRRLSAAVPSRDSVRAIAAKDSGKGAEEDADVEPDRPVLDVLAIQANDLLEVDDAASTAHLPESGNAWFRAEPPKVMRLVVLEIGLEEGPRSNE